MTARAYETDNVGDGLVRLALEKPDGWPVPAGESNNVYLVQGEPPALINAGHPVQFDQLEAAVRDLGHEFAAIDRFVHTDWSVEVLGGATHAGDADHFVRSPDMVRPRDYAEHLKGRREALRDFAADLREREVFSDTDSGALDEFLDAYYAGVPSTLDFVPVRGGHVVRAGELELEVIPAPGPGPGHTALYEADRGWLFTGDFALRGLPSRMNDVQSYFVSLERLVELDPDRLFPNRGDPRDRGRWALETAHRFINNFMSNAPRAMYKEPTLVEFARRDWGYIPDDFAEALLRLDVYRSLVEELVRSQMIDAEGDGLDRKYGVDVEDPRGDIREL